jgi:hypothetical protein
LVSHRALLSAVYAEKMHAEGRRGVEIRRLTFPSRVMPGEIGKLPACR